MIKDIAYSGYSTQLSDYECPDGSLAMSLNLVPEDSHLAPISKPTPILDAGNYRCLLIHQTATQDNYIFSCRNGAYTKILWEAKTELNGDAIKTATPTEIMQVSGKVLDVAVIGNTLALATEEGLKFALWRDGSYIPLDEHPPFVAIDFGAKVYSALSARDEYDIPKRCSVLWNSNDETNFEKAEETELETFTNKVYGFLLKHISESITSQGHFYQPMFVRYAFRLFDGSYIMHSAPILITPTVTPPCVWLSDKGSANEDSTVTTTFTLHMPIFDLAYRINLGDDATKFAAWEDIISAIDIFVSAPIYTYEQSKNIKNPPVVHPSGLSKNGFVVRVKADEADESDEKLFCGHYAIMHSSEFTDKYVDNKSNDAYVANIPYNLDFHKDVRDVHTFYKVASIPFEDIKDMSLGGFEKLILSDLDLTSLQTKPTLPDDYQSHCSLYPTTLYAFNSRLNMAGLSISPAKPMPLRSCMQFGNPEGISAASFEITVYTRKNGVRCCAKLHDTLPWFYPAGNIPRYLFYPDNSAYQIEIKVSDDEVYRFPLKQHDFLNGAYYYNDNYANSGIEGVAEQETECNTTIVDIGSKIYTSEVNNPFYIPITGISTVGNGRVISLSSATKALSQGQFGQFPLYAFTDEGIWSLQTTSTGTYASATPVSRDICLSPGAITQLDSSVLFTTNRGIMLLSGSTTQCISEAIDAEYPFDVSSLSGMSTLFDMLLPHDFTKGCIAIAPFRTFLKDCNMVYDYSHQRIIIFNSEYGYAYVYSMKSNQWGMMYSDLAYSIPSYSTALAATNKGKLVDFSIDMEPMKGLLVTRPIKLGMTDVLKTVDAVIQRGFFANGHVNVALYGSRDLVSWYLIWSSKDHYLRGFRGTPYKYFRMACVTSLINGESLFGASFSFAPRLTNQIR
ncbi:MAG: hypothetical protein ACI30X_07145 [Muribaculaceae bacterium]